jgi:transposase
MVVVTVLITQTNGQVQKLTRTFATMTADLMALADWLDSLQVVQIAMESTGVFTPPTMLPMVRGFL